MRPEATANFGYVPTPDCVIDSVRALLDLPPGAHAIDPCCGDGAALERLAPGAVRYGIELEPSRARSAQSRLDSVVVGDGTQCRVSHNAFGLMLLNPPYSDSTEGRAEKVFLERCTPYLRPNGVLVFIISSGRYGLVVQHLRKRYHIAAHWRFPDGVYHGEPMKDDPPPGYASGGYGQTVLIATKLPHQRSEWFGSKRRFWAEDLRLPDAWYGTSGVIPADEIDPMPTAREVAQSQRQIDVPMTNGPALFTTSLPEPSVLAEMVQSSPIRRTMRLPPQISAGRPLLPLGKGHIALTLASGLINGVYGSGADRHVAKGIVTRKVSREVESQERGRNEQSVKETIIEGFSVSVRALTADGTIHTIQDTGAK